MDQLKMDVYETVLFTTRNGRLAPKHPKIKKVVYGLINGMGRTNSFSELETLGEAASRAWEVLKSFRLQGDATWTAVLDGRDAHNLNRLVKAIVVKLEHELPLTMNVTTRRVYDPETGRYMYLTVDFESIDAPVFDANGEQIGTVGDEVSDSIWTQQEYIKNPFLIWFRENRHEFLTKRQNSFIDSLSVEMAKDSGYVETDDFKELAGIDRTNFGHMKQRIYERTMKAWELDGVTLRESYLLGEVAKWSEFTNIVESDEDLAEQNVKLSAWLRGNDEEDTYDFEKEQKSNGKDLHGLSNALTPIDLAYDALAGDTAATQAFVKFLKGGIDVLPANVLYKINSAVESHIAQLKRSLDEYMPSAPISPDYDAKLKNTVRKVRYDEFKSTQPTYVYNREGKLVRTMEPKEPISYKIMKLDAYGSMQEIK
jgi:hypothetical protein